MFFVYAIIVGIGGFLHANLIYSPIVSDTDALTVSGDLSVIQAAARKDRILDLQDQIRRRDARIAQLEEAYAAETQR